jgi:hypothetical protein
MKANPTQKNVSDKKSECLWRASGADSGHAYHWHLRSVLAKLNLVNHFAAFARMTVLAAGRNSSQRTRKISRRKARDIGALRAFGPREPISRL